MWNQQTRVLAFQVGIGDGNGTTILGDHDIWRLPQADDSSALSPRNPSHFAAHRPVFVANAPGQPISPNLAGGVAAAFGLCAQVFATSDPAYAARCLLDGQTIYDQANLAPQGPLLASVPSSYYPVKEWRANMEFAAIELYLATAQLGSQVPGLPHPAPDYYLVAAGHLANDYMVESTTGEESLSLYDVSTLADFDLVHVLGTPAAQPLLTPNQLETNVPTVMSDRHDQLALATRLAAGIRSPRRTRRPTRTPPPTPSAMPRRARSMTSSRGVRPSRPSGRHSSTGRSAPMPGAPRSWSAPGPSSRIASPTRSPTSSGSLTGRGAILTGATVDGPVAPSAVAGLTSIAGSRPCPAGGAGDPFAAQDAHGFAYRDDVRSSATSEASDDVAAVALLAAAAEAARG